MSKNFELLEKFKKSSKSLRMPQDYCPDKELLCYMLYESPDLSTAIVSTDQISLMSPYQMETEEKLQLEHGEMTTLLSIDIATLKKGLESMEWNNVSLYDDVLTIIKKHCYLPDECSYHLLASFVIHTYMYTVFKHTPYIYLWGSQGSGKSTTSQLIADLSFNGVHLSNPTPATVRRTVDGLRGMISMDDAENLARGDQETQEFRSQLNAGYKTNAKTSLVEGDRNKKPKTLFIGGPKSFNSIQGLEDVLSDRSIYIRMAKATHDYPFRIFIESGDETCTVFRSRLLLWALYNHRAVRNHYLNFRKQHSGRRGDLFSPLAAIAKFFDDIVPMVGVCREEEIRKCFLISDELKKNKKPLIDFAAEALKDIWLHEGKPSNFSVTSESLANELVSFDELSSQYGKNAPHRLKSEVPQHLDAAGLIVGRKRVRDIFGFNKVTKYEINTHRLQKMLEEMGYEFK